MLIFEGLKQILVTFSAVTPPLLHKFLSASPIYEVIFKIWQPFHLIKVGRTENFTSNYPPKCGQTGRVTIFSAKNTQPFSLQSQVFYRARSPAAALSLCAPPIKDAARGTRFDPISLELIELQKSFTHQ